jgi:hypothetical protein
MSANGERMVNIDRTDLPGFRFDARIGRDKSS